MIRLYKTGDKTSNQKTLLKNKIIFQKMYSSSNQKKSVIKSRFYDKLKILCKPEKI